MNLPNKLSALRILLVPIIIGLLFIGTFVGDLLALIVFIAAAITDRYDGYFARKYDMITALGKILDPLADKLLIYGVLIAFVQIGKITAWPVIIIIARGLAVTGLRVVAADQGSVIAASIWGKVKTTIQIITVIALIIDPHIINLPVYMTKGLVWIAVLITVYSGYKYFAGAEVDYS
ncbi:CDP-diacylglycerol--glycerol-3-phosphate 3-phosphatidyltransferase [Halanaerobium hydrogeniformans]|uniref:CDP-diacylglycerol--glycerol-3-phosphate 3-phosphatidyltransferase n=1 Tax=Halanaerobium hydrogeniformans TaxID=656519 RepID=E4RKK0_HALHG|nr:CDP-diacylglycerol--glycerol-3-phosphate 3-phosphatidyltransferase [Halanaerobium hydrogeniformans]ADQ14709.1 CDP-diacylglycerol/glycerol-3-phosphate 3-phosphatidyltransferase [Halanaerobium hydrogeniformans]